MNSTVQTFWKVLVNVEGDALGVAGTLFNISTAKSFIRSLGGRTNFVFSPQTLTCTSRFYDLLRGVAAELGFEGRKFPFFHPAQRVGVNLRFRLYPGVLAIEIERSPVELSQFDDPIAKTTLWSQGAIAELVLHIIGLIAVPTNGFQALKQRPKVFTCNRIVGEEADLPGLEGLVRLLTRHVTATDVVISKVVEKNQSLQSDSSTLLVDRQGVVAAIPSSLASDNTTIRRFPAAVHMLELVACVERMVELRSLLKMPRVELEELSSWFENPERRFRFSTSSLHIWQCLCSEFGLAPDEWMKIKESTLTTLKPGPYARSIQRDDDSRRVLFPEKAKEAAMIEGSVKEDRHGLLESCQRVDFAIIAIRDDEFAAVLKFFKPYESQKGTRRDYFLASITTKAGRVFRVAMLRAHEQGHSSAQAAASDVIADLDPKWLILVGIAGAVPESEFSLGDVVLASRIADFSVTAALPDGSTEYAARGGPAHKAVQDLVSRLVPLKSQIGAWNKKSKVGLERPVVTLTDDRFVGSPEWADKVKQTLQRSFGPTGTELKRLPLVTSASIGSGNKLMKDPDLLREWLNFSRDLKAVEMELPGVYEAARDRKGDRPVLAIRGISDVVGYKRSPEWTEYACNTAASFAHALITSDAIEP